MTASAKTVDKTAWGRTPHFEHFSQRDYPYVGFCADVELTNSYYFAKAHSISIFNLVSYAVLAAANEIREFRLRIHGEEVVEYESLRFGFIAMTKEPPLFSFGEVEHGKSFSQFAEYLEAEKARISEKVTLEGGPDKDDVIYTSCLPWLRFTSFVHPVNLNVPSSIPLISWGKIIDKDGYVDMPVSVQTNHALMDGWHISLYYKRLQELLAEPEKLVSEMG
ncbi:chloramphenicol acetyltransferase [Vibrio nigripulchritudo ATCC 27043]|uniref:CatA-like O-acetyltransferase n=1 Tax=Vibrio nigripulchritudo TaxID=28173 RepID=UPI00021C2661|nr:CatA-like O-acetyltransferase [Vibrio nigripulchritudo]EGU58888.1 chloramphenicol acetyltransferase [Vibrio nigripulchritudo ATCC 27043]